MTSPPVTLTMTLSISSLLMRALPDQHTLRAFLMDEGVWPVGALSERWQPDFTNPGAYTVSLEMAVPLPSGRDA